MGAMSVLVSGRRSAVLVSLALAAATAAPLAAAPSAHAATCGTVVSATKNGATLPVNRIGTLCSPGGAGEGSDVSWSVWDGPSDSPSSNRDLGLASHADTYVITLDTGTILPRVTDTHGGDVTVRRAKQGDGHWYVTITAKPVLATGECNQSATPWTCPSVATRQWDGYLGGNITDYGTWEDEAQRNAFFGMDYASNIDAGSIPPQIVTDDAGAQMILLEFANSHYQQTPSTTVFKGQASIVIPNAFLKEVYEVDDPASLTTSGLAPVLTGSGSGTVSVTDIGGALKVTVTDMTFSKRNLKIHRGNIRPGKPGHLTAERQTAGKVKLSYTRAKARGSKIKGYTITCIAKSGPKHVVTVLDRRPNTTVTGLHTNTAYTCKVKARSKAGAGRWAKVGVDKRP
jgi:hypothetical protein